MTWILAAPRSAIGCLKPLIRARERRQSVRVIEAGTREALREAAAGASAILLVGDRRRSPRTALPGLVITDPEGNPVPVGWLPDLGDGLATFASAATRVERRDGPVGPLAILGQRQARFLELARRMEVNLGGDAGPPFPVVRWTAERIVRPDVVRALRLGLGFGIYFGHGRPTGWAAYHGLRAPHLTEAPGEPVGALLSITCLTANRGTQGLSFSEAIVVGGACAAAVGAVSTVAHLTNMRLMLGLVEAVRRGESRIGPAMVSAAGGAASDGAPYRIIGDPLAPLVGATSSAQRAARVFAPAAEYAA